MQDVWNKYWSNQSVDCAEKISFFDPYYQLLKRLVGSSKCIGFSILEVGCGSGIRTLAWVQEQQRRDVTATFVDCSSAALALARSCAKANSVDDCVFIMADGLNLPFRVGTFDEVWNEGVNEHLVGSKRQKIFQEMSRVCKVGGHVTVIVPNALNFPYRLWKSFLTHVGRWEFGYENPFTIFELNDCMKNAALSPQKQGGVMTLRSMLKLLPRKKSCKESTSVILRGQTRGSPLKRVLFHVENRIDLLWGHLFGSDIGIKAAKSEAFPSLTNQ